MANEHKSFYAADAFAYVDTYRRLSMESPAAINASMERVKEQMLGVKSIPSRVYAELRAHEHALDSRLKKEEAPGLVVIGEKSDEGEALPVHVRQALEEKLHVEAELERARAQIKKVTEWGHDLDAQVIKKTKELGRLQRRYSQAVSSYGITIAALVAGIFVLAGILLLR